MKITFDDIQKNEAIRTYIQKADESLIALGYTEHSFTHVTRVAKLASDILLTLGYSEREAELAQIAGYLHDIGNVINRVDHAQSGAVMAFRILDKMGADPEDIATIITAIGNQDFASFDIHDRVNYSVRESRVSVVKNSHIELDLKIDTEICAVMDYFEIFLNRMVLCRKAAENLDVKFWLYINGQRLI